MSTVTGEQFQGMMRNLYLTIHTLLLHKLLVLEARGLPGRNLAEMASNFPLAPYLQENGLHGLALLVTGLFQFVGVCLLYVVSCVHV